MGMGMTKSTWGLLMPITINTADKVKQGDNCQWEEAKMAEIQHNSELQHNKKCIRIVVFLLEVSWT